jgi:glycosyltransferase involved in cell wall biosynthesis
MQLSVLIPVFKNFPAALLQALETEIKSHALAAEIVVYDDSADDRCFYWHQQFTEHPFIRIYKAPENLGRSATRNRLMELGRGAWFVFLDGDMLISPGFLVNYMQDAASGTVFCGGIKSSPDSTGLRACYSKVTEEKPAEQRNRRPHRSFSAANFLMPAALKANFQFPSVHTGYGHEDTHFGLQLLAAGVKVRHLNNAALHQGLDPDDVFVEKSKEAVKNLVKMYRSDALLARHANQIRLIRSWHMARNLGVMFLIFPFSAYFENRLKSGKCALRMFALLKLCWFERFYRLG